MEIEGVYRVIKIDEEVTKWRWVLRNNLRTK
jgi:hypothetical protein